MNNKQKVIIHLETFRNKKKFSLAAWEERGLNASSDEVCDYLETIINDCTDNLIEGFTNEANPEKLKEILLTGLTRTKNRRYDTEEKEFICDYFEELAKCAGLNIADDLNFFLYDRGLVTLMKIVNFFKGPEKVQETLSQKCSNCHAELKTLIIRKEKGIPDYAWFVAKCSVCSEYNLLSLIPGIKQMRHENYTILDQLPKHDYNEEQARLRMEQIKFFRR